jgi:predicted XRE-type DNA-binding protein
MQYDYTPKDVDRFWSKVDKSAGPDDCWIWNGNKNKQGYGRVWWNGKLHAAHRVAYELSFGGMPPELDVCHKCDNPSCCNPSHFFLGTNKDNMHDMIRKGRNVSSPGEKNALSKLTDEIVSEIQRQYSTGEANQMELARMHGVAQSQISRVINHKAWKHVS